MLLSYAPKISLLCSQLPKHASTILQLNAQLEYFINECSIGVFYLGGDCSIRVYRSYNN